MQIASFEKRIFAYIVDFGIALTLSILLYIFVFMNLLGFDWYYSLLLVPTFASLLYIILVGFFAYFTNGVTLGNLIFGLRMVSIKCIKLSFRQVMLKFLPLSLFPCVFINAIFMLYKHTGKTIFDMLSHTVSVSIR